MVFPSLEQVLGLDWRGIWVSNHTYFRDDAVIYNNKIYIVTAAETIALPTDTGSWVLYRNHSVSQELSAGIISPTPFTPPPPVSEWTWANQGTAVAYDDPAGIKFVVGPDDTVQFCLFILGDIPDSPYTITVAAAGFIGIVLLDPVSGNFKTGTFGDIIYFDDPTTLDSIATEINTTTTSGGLDSSTHWFRMQDDGTNLMSGMSSDGLFFNILSVAPNTDFVVPTKYGVFVQGAPSWPDAPQICQPYLISFELTTP